MQQRGLRFAVAWLLAPLVFLASAVPVPARACLGSIAKAPARTKCCGCCQERLEESTSSAVAKQSCCAKAAEAAKPKCCCQKGSREPVAPAPLPESDQASKQILSAGLAAQPGLVSPVHASHWAQYALLPADVSQPPIRVLFCVWLI